MTSLLVGALVASSVYACSGDDDDKGPGAGVGGEGGMVQIPDYEIPTIVDAGLIFTIDKVDVSDSGVATVEFTITDEQMDPLDLDGKLTRGAVTPSFILSWLGEDENGQSLQYTAYTTRVKTADNGTTATQSSTDQGGTYTKLALGKYRYTFGTKIDITAARSKLTHTLGVYATRSFDDVRYVASALHSWVPDGSEVETIHDVVADEACNSCHTRLEFHGGARRGVGMCNLCHTEENSINPESGNTIDFQVMIHKLHMGANLPSVQAGEPYYFVGFGNRTVDYSEVEYPWDMRDCGKCHQGTQGERWVSMPSQKPCASCHDRTYFGKGDAPEGWTKHSGGPRDDSECIVCHADESLYPIKSSHYTTLTDPDRPKVEARIISVTNASPGNAPLIEMEFSVNGRAHDIIDQPFDRIRMRIWGPNSDVNTSWNETISTAPACAATPVAPCIEEQGTTYIYHAKTAFPSNATGSYQVGLDGRYAWVILDGQGAVVSSTNVPFVNPVTTVAVTGDLEPRRKIVSLEKCNSCHGDLGFHGGGYKDPAYCLNCHNTTAYRGTVDAIVPGETVVQGSINLKDFIHGIHSEAAYPAPLNDCEQCHLEGTYNVPLADGLLSSTYGSTTCPPNAMQCLDGMGGGPGEATSTTFKVQPEGAACTSCHSDRATAAHADTNTSTIGEACGTCHGEGKLQGVGYVHQLAP